MTGTHGQPARRLAAIMFTDLVGYSALANRDEALAIELLELHRVWIREILPKHGGVEIETVGDAFLVEFAGALAAVECAFAIQQRFAQHNQSAPADRRLELRIGIHLGDIEHKDGKVMGDGVNIASRIHGMAEPGGTCVSETIHQVLHNRAGLRFDSLGRPALKNIATSVELFRVGIEGSPRQRMPLRPKLRYALAVALVAAVAASAAGVWRLSRGPSPNAMPSIAVLPFDNLSVEADSAYFTDGLHDTVIGHLARIQGLKVISRTSVMRYRDNKPSLREIGRELDVAHILEGSVQRAGARLRVTAQLIDAASDAHVWSNEYDRELADVFAVQADIAQQVAKAVQVRLTSQEQASIQAVPTQNQAAYDLYLRAVLVSRSRQIDEPQLRQAIDWLNQAIALDADFAAAYALAAKMHDYMHWNRDDPTDARRRLVGENADKALSLDPTLPDAHVAKALNFYHGTRNYEAAIRELEVARDLAPNNAEVPYWLGPIYRRQARWADALAALERATALDPLNALFQSEYAITLMNVRRYADAEQAIVRLQHLDPAGVAFSNGWLAYTRFLQTGELSLLTKAVAGLPAGVNPYCQIRSFTAVFERRFDQAAAAIDACKDSRIQIGTNDYVPKEYFSALARWHGSGGRPPPEAPGVRADLEKMLAERPDQPGTRMILALTHVMLGDRQRALKEADRALEQMPLSRDAVDGAVILSFAVGVHANTGAEERALDELGQVLKLPYGPHAQELRIDPVYDPLRKHPRFQRLLDKHLPGKGS